MEIGYIIKYAPNSSHDAPRFEFKEAHFTRKITSRGDKVYSNILAIPIDYADIVSSAEIMKKNPNLILVQEPFLLDDELRFKAKTWVDWANSADIKDYDPFAGMDDTEE